MEGTTEKNMPWSILTCIAERREAPALMIKYREVLQSNIGAAGLVTVNVIEEKEKQVKVRKVSINHSGAWHGNTLLKGTSGYKDLGHIADSG